MYRIIITTCLAGVLVSCKPGKADSPMDRQPLNKICDDIMKHFADKDFSRAVQVLKRNSIMTGLDSLETTIINQLGNYEKPIGYKFLGEKKVDEVIVQRLYLLMYNSYFLKVSYILYNSGAGWQITAFKYNDDINDLLY